MAIAVAYAALFSILIMKDKRYITISEFGDVHMIKVEIAPEVISAADDGLYDILDITDPDAPMRYWEGGWTDVDELPDYEENASREAPRSG